MTEATLTALIAGGFALAATVVNVFGGKRLERQVQPPPSVPPPPAPEPKHEHDHELTEADLLRSAILRHIIRRPSCADDLANLL